MRCCPDPSAIYEADFLPCCYGYRDGRSAQDAIRDMTDVLQRERFEFVVEADTKGFFDHLQPEWLLKMLAVRIDDEALLQLIRKWLRAGILEEDGRVEHPETGTPQGRASSVYWSAMGYLDRESWKRPGAGINDRAGSEVSPDRLRQ